MTGALAAGRIGTAVLAVLLPLIARSAVAAFALDGADADRAGWRPVWTLTLLLTLATAFTPVVWPLAAALGAAALVLRRARWKAYGLRLLAALAVPLLALAPWSLGLLLHPGRLLREAGLPYATGSANGPGLVAANPGGPGTGGSLLLAGIVLAALAALLRADRRLAVRTAWATALAALLLAVLLDRAAWAGPATLVHGLALLAAALLGADGARVRVAARSFGWRQPVAVLIALAAAAGPLIGAAGWVLDGADGPLRRRDPVQVPAFVADAGGDDNQTRTLVLDREGPATVSYSLVRGSGGSLGDAEAIAATGGDPRLDKVVSNLVAGSGADQSSQLSAFAIRFVMFRPGGPEDIRRVLDATPASAAATSRTAPPSGASNPGCRAPSSSPPSRARRPSRSPPAPSRPTAGSRPAKRAACCASPTGPTPAGRPPSTASPSSPGRWTAGPRASNCPPPPAASTSSTRTPCRAPCGTGSRASSPSCCS